MSEHQTLAPANTVGRYAYVVTCWNVSCSRSYEKIEWARNLAEARRMWGHESDHGRPSDVRRATVADVSRLYRPGGES